MLITILIATVSIMWGIGCMVDKGLTPNFYNEYTQIELGGPALIIIGLIILIVSILL